jgi:hypothetical protein
LIANSDHFMFPRVSVIVPAHNASPTIGETIESVLSQSYSDIELIVIDDGSADATGQIVSGYQRRDRRITYIRQENAGVSAARNKGLEVATGKYVSALDADDLWEKDKLQKQLVAISATKETVVLTGIRRFEQIGGKRSWGQVTMPPRTTNGRYDAMTLLSLSIFQMVMINTALMERQLALRVGGWKVGMWTGQDWDFWIRVSRECSYRNIEEPLSYYRKHPESGTSKQRRLSALDEHEKVIRRQLDEGYVSKRAAQQALIGRQLEICGYFIYQGELARAIQVLSRSLSLLQGWKTRAAWTRGAEILSLAFRKLSIGK